MEKNNEYSKYIANPRLYTLKKWFYELLGLSYSNHDTIIERISGSLTTQKDIEDFGKLVGQVYEIGYRKAIEDYKKEVEKLGMKIEIVSPIS